MNNLSIENLSRVVQVGDAESLVGSRIERAQTGSPQEGHGKTFSDILRESVDQVNTYQNDADKAIKELVAGRTKNIHETMLAVEREDTSLKLMTQVRNKVLDAYKEIMKMQV